MYICTKSILHTQVQVGAADSRGGVIINWAGKGKLQRNHGEGVWPVQWIHPLSLISNSPSTLVRSHHCLKRRTLCPHHPPQCNHCRPLLNPCFSLDSSVRGTKLHTQVVNSVHPPPHTHTYINFLQNHWIEVPSRLVVWFNSNN